MAFHTYPACSLVLIPTKIQLGELKRFHFASVWATTAKKTTASEARKSPSMYEIESYMGAAPGTPPALGWKFSESNVRHVGTIQTCLDDQSKKHEVVLEHGCRNKIRTIETTHEFSERNVLGCISCILPPSMLTI